MVFENSGNGSLYNFDQLMKRILDEIELTDIPFPVSNTEVIEHFENSVLKPFSVYAPRMEKIRFGEECRVKIPENSAAYRRYRMPMYRFPTSQMLGISSCEPISNLGYSNEYGPVPFMGAPDTMLEAMADIRMYASMGASTNRSLTTYFIKPDVIDLYGGYSGCSYEAILLLTHDMSLSTVPDTAFESLVELAVLDFEAWFYTKLHRKNNMDTPVGNINLDIDKWANAGEDKKQLLKSWKEEGYNLNIESIHFFG